MISNILFKKPVPVGALFLSDDHLESVHHILADLVYVESETKPEKSDMKTDDQEGKYPIGYARFRKGQQDQENILRSKVINKLKEGSNIMPVGKDIPKGLAYNEWAGNPKITGSKEPKRAPKNELIESALQSVNDRLNVLHGEVIWLIESIKGDPVELKAKEGEPPQKRPMNVLLNELPKDFAEICNRINANIENVQSIRDLIL